MYGVHLVCCEDILLTKLYEKVFKPEEESSDADAGTRMNENATKEMSRFLMENPDEATRSWLFKLLEEEVSKIIDNNGEGAVILIDMVPNLKFLLKASAFKDDPSNKDIEKFETKFPIQFAINLSLDKKDLMNNMAVTHAPCTKSKEAAQKNAEKQEKNDEIDMSRTERRFNIYVNSVEEFVTYFKNKGKLLDVDTSACDIEAVWMSIRDYFIDTEIAAPVSGIEQVVLFQLGDRDFTDVDQERYPMLHVSCAEFTENYTTATPNILLKELDRVMRKNAIDQKTFLVNCQNTNLLNKHVVRDAFSGNRLLFLEEEIGTLDFFLHGLRRKSQRKKSIAPKNAQLYKTLTTSDNEALIFPLDADSELCRMICIGFINSK
jgi:hypothetical protein